MEFRLPNLGEGIDSATVTAVLVKTGDAVTAGQNVISVETDKAAVDVPAEANGTIGAVLVKPGDKIPVGAPIFQMATGNSTAAPASPPPAPPKAAPAPQPAATPAPENAKPSPKAAPTASAEVRLPNLGEGIDLATVTAILVKPGESISVGQNILSVETDKAAVDVPAEVAGTVDAIRVKPGDKIPIGQVVITLSGGAAAPAAASPAAAVTTTAPAKAASPKPQAVSSAPQQTNGTTTKTIYAAGPATRRLARELGVGLGEVNGSARGGRITLDDIKNFVRSEREKPRQATATTAGLSGKTVADSYTHPALPDFSKFGEVEKRSVANIRQTIAKNLTVAWRTMPMVTQHDLADITDLEAGRKRIVEALPKGSPKITWTVLALKAVVAVLKEFPHFNSSYDMNAGELYLKKYFHIGMAVDTERGLVVPVIRDADKKSIRDLATEVAVLAEKAKAGKLGIDDMRGGTFTISNLGGIGGTAFTPIVNYPEVAILGLSRSSLQPVVRDGQVVPRLMLPLSLTYDHRVIDGADGARFSTRLVQLFSDPFRLLMET